MAYFIIVFIGFLVFHLATRKYLNPYKLIMVFGKKGSGKTTLLTKIAINDIKKGKKVFSTIDIPGTQKFDVNEIGIKTFPPDSTILIDEAGMTWDSRDFSKFPKHVRDFFKYQRQYKLRVWLFSQTFDVDKKIRDLTDEMYLIKNFMRVWSIRRRIIKTITISHGSENGTGTSSIIDDYKYDLPIPGVGIQFTFIPRYVVFFKSFDPKKLTYIDGKYLDMNDLQKQYLSTRGWLFGCFKVGFVRLIGSIKSIFVHESY